MSPRLPRQEQSETFPSLQSSGCGAAWHQHLTQPWLRLGQPRTDPLQVPQLIPIVHPQGTETAPPREQSCGKHGQLPTGTGHGCTQNPPGQCAEGTEGHPCAGMQRPAHPRCSSAFVSAGGQEPAPWHRLLQTQPQQPLLQPAEQGPWRDEITAMNSSGGGREPARPEPRWAGASSGSRAGAALAQDPLCLRPSLEQRGEPLSPERGQQLLTPPVKERAGCGLCSPQQYVICHDSNR